MTEHRSLSRIANEISSNWQNVNYAAAPYLAAMRQLDDINDHYIYDSASSVVRYFLANARAWRGATAKRIKVELNTMLKG